MVMAATGVSNHNRDIHCQKRTLAVGWIGGSTWEMAMSLWNIFGKFAVSDTGESIQKVSDTTSISSDGTTYITMGRTTVGSDGSLFTQTGSFSTDGSTRMGSTATGLGAVFNDPKEDRFGFDKNDDDKW